MRLALRLLTAAAALALVGAPAGVAPAADKPTVEVDGPAATSALHTVTPAAIRPGDTVTLTGTVTNIGDEPLANVQALPRYSRDPLESRTDVGRVPDDIDVNKGIRFREPYVVAAELLQPGESAEFSLSIPVDDLGFSDAGVYAIGVDIRARPEDGPRIDLDTSRTVIPWLPDDEPLPSVPVAMLWPVTAQPNVLPDGSMVDDSVATQLASKGRLGAILGAVTAAAEAGTPAPVSWMVDPDVVATVDTMAAGYEVRTAEGPVEGTGSRAARAWRRDFDAAVDGADVTVLPFARPDIEALATHDLELATDVADQAAAASKSAARSVASGAGTDVAWLDGRGLGDTSLGVLAGAGTTTVVAPSGAVDPATRGRARVTTANGDVDLLLTDSGLDAAIAGVGAATDPEAGALEFRQRWLAETAMVALDAAADDEAPAPMIAAPPPRWSPSPAAASAVLRSWTGAPWVTPTTVADLPAAGDPPAVDAAPDDGADALPAANVAATAALATEALHYSAMLADADGADDGLGLATLRSISSGWRDDPAAGEAFTMAITGELSRLIDQVDVTVPPSVTLSSREGVFPLTLTNDLDEAVVVRLDVRSTNVDRLEISDIEPQTVEAGERATVTVTAQASSNGRVPIDVQLVSSDGQPLGEPKRTVVNATDYGTIGWVIMGGAGVLFGAALIRRAVRARRGRDDDQVAADHDDDRPEAPETAAAAHDPSGSDTGGAPAPTMPPDVPAPRLPTRDPGRHRPSTTGQGSW